MQLQRKPMDVPVPKPDKGAGKKRIKVVPKGLQPGTRIANYQTEMFEMTAPLNQSKSNKDRLGSGKSSSVLPLGIHTNAEDGQEVVVKRKTIKNSAKKENCLNGSKSLLDFSKVASEVSPINEMFQPNGGTGGASSTNNGKKVTSTERAKESSVKAATAIGSASVGSKRSIKQSSKRTKKHSQSQCCTVSDESKKDECGLDRRRRSRAERSSQFKDEAQPITNLILIDQQSSVAFSQADPIQPFKTAANQDNHPDQDDYSNWGNQAVAA